MKKIILIIVPFLIILIGIVVFLLINKPKKETINSNVVEDTNPKIEILSDGVSFKNVETDTWQIAKNGQEINSGALIKTDESGRAQIIYPTGTVTRLDSNTQITLTNYQPSPQQVDITIDNGTIWSRIVKLLGGESYNTESKNLVASVRGTAYEHRVLADGSDQLTVASHVVHLKCKNNLETDVPENFVTQTSCKARPTLRRVLQAERDTAWSKLNRDEDLKIIKRFQKAIYDDSDLNKPTSTTLPTFRPTPTPKPSISLTPSIAPTPTHTPLAINSVTLICGVSIPTPNGCGDGHTKIEVKGSGFTTGITVSVIPVPASPQPLTNVAPSPTPIPGDHPADAEGNQWPQIINSSDLIAHFSTALRGTFYVRIILNNQTIDDNQATFTTY